MLALFNVGGGEVILLLFLFMLLPLALLSFAFWIWMLIDSIKNERLKDGEKVAWVLVIALTHLLGAVIYFFAGRSRRA